MEEQFGLARMYQSLSEKLETETEIFRNWDEACAGSGWRQGGIGDLRRNESYKPKGQIPC